MNNVGVIRERSQWDTMILRSCVRCYYEEVCTPIPKPNTFFNFDICNSFCVKYKNVNKNMPTLTLFQKRLTISSRFRLLLFEE